MPLPRPPRMSLARGFRALRGPPFSAASALSADRLFPCPPCFPRMPLPRLPRNQPIAERAGRAASVTPPFGVATVVICSVTAARAGEDASRVSMASASCLVASASASTPCRIHESHTAGVSRRIVAKEPGAPPVRVSSNRASQAPRTHWNGVCFTSTRE